MSKFEVYDLETLSNLFTYTGYDCSTKTWRQFVICDWRNDLKELLEWLDTLKKEDYYQVGFNNENFDYPIIHYILNHRQELLYKSGQEVAQDLYQKAQELISESNGKQYNAISDRNKFIKQLDLFKIWHYDNAARRTSLKDLEVCMHMPNVEEMPIDHRAWCIQGDEKLVLSYNKNDVEATYLFFKTTLGQTDYSLYRGKNKLKLRGEIRNAFGLPCLNYPDVKIGEQLILNLYSEKTGMSLRDIKNLGGTHRDVINLKDCIPVWANFESKEFKALKEKFEKTTIRSSKGEFSESVIFHGIKIDYGTGGAHSSAQPGVYEADDYWTILDEDIGLAQRPK